MDLKDLKIIHSNYIGIIVKNQEDIQSLQQEVDLLKIENRNVLDEHRNRLSMHNTQKSQTLTQTPKHSNCK